MSDDLLDSKDIVDLIPLDKSTNNIAQQIINEENLDKIQNLTHLFNINQAKRNVLRVMKLNSLLDKVSDQMIERFDAKPGEFSNNDLLNYMNVVQSSIDRANKQLNLVDEAPQISLTQVNVNVEENALNRESRAKITEAVNKILQMSKKLEINLDNDTVNDTVNSIEIADTDIIIESDRDDSSTVLNNNNLLNEEE